MYLEAYKVLGDKNLAEDTVSESFVRILNKLDRIDEVNKNATKSFLSIISRNVAIDLYKKKLHLNNNENMVVYYLNYYSYSQSSSNSQSYSGSVTGSKVFKLSHTKTFILVYSV